MGFAELAEKIKYYGKTENSDGHNHQNNRPGQSEQMRAFNQIVNNNMIVFGRRLNNGILTSFNFHPVRHCSGFSRDIRFIRYRFKKLFNFRTDYIRKKIRCVGQIPVSADKNRRVSRCIRQNQIIDPADIFLEFLNALRIKLPDHNITV